MIEVRVESADEDWIVILCTGEGIKDTRHTVKSEAAADNPDLVPQIMAAIKAKAERRQQVAELVKQYADS